MKRIRTSFLLAISLIFLVFLFGITTVEANTQYYWQKYKLSTIKATKPISQGTYVGYFVNEMTRSEVSSWEEHSYSVYMNYATPYDAEVAATKQGKYQMYSDVQVQTQNTNYWRQWTRDIYFMDYDRTLVDTVTGSETAYPNNGVHTDGFYYVRGGIVNGAPHIPVFNNVASGYTLNHTNPVFYWNFTDPDAGDYQTAYQIVGSKDGFANWHYNSGELASGTTGHAMPPLGDGNWHFAVRTRDSKGAWSPDWGYVYNVKLDATSPYSGVAHSDHAQTHYTKQADGSTFRFHTINASDNLAGLYGVHFWSKREGIDADWTHTAWGNHWYEGAYYYDMPVRGEGSYIITAHALDHAGNGHGQNGWSNNIDMRVVVDRTNPVLQSDAIMNADFTNGNDYWVKPGKHITTKIRAKDEYAGMYRIFQVFTGTNGTSGHSWINYNYWDNIADAKFDNDVTLGGVEAFDVLSNAKSYHSANEAEMTLTLAIKPTTGVKHYNFRYNLVDKSSNETLDKNTGKRLIVDGQKPTGVITANTTAPTNQTVLLTATGNDGNGSGIRRIRLPHGSYVPYSSFSYNATANGTYTFEFEDNVGNVTIETITLTNIDKVAPTIAFTPEVVEASFKDITVQTAIADVGGSGYEAYRYVWTKDETYPTDGWSEWGVVPNPILTQTQGGKWYLHLEARDHAGNISYAYSGIYEKIVVSGGPSVNINVYPMPTGVWTNKLIDAYVMDSGDAELLAKAKKYYEVTNSPLYPSAFSKTIPTDKKVQVNLQGENFIHVQYVLDDGTKISSTAGPYLIDTGAIGDIEVKLANTSGAEVTTWTNQNLRLVLNALSSSTVSGIQKQYRIEGFHTDWQPYTDGMVISAEGSQRIYGRIVNGAGVSSESKWVQSFIDKTAPTVQLVQLQVNANNTYSVTVNATDSLSSVKDVAIDSGIKLSQKGNSFTISGLATKPVTVTVKDAANNSAASVSFEAEPVISFKEPYTLAAETYREDIVVQFSNTNHYQIGKQVYQCLVAVCEAVVKSNTTVTAFNENGIKQTSKAVSITNMDKSALTLVLSGKRNLALPAKLEFEWNYSLASGQLVCAESGSQVIHPLTGTNYAFTGKNSIYECYVEGVYGGEQVKSNKVMIFADVTLPTEGAVSVQKIPKKTNVHIDENSTGDAYMINTKRDNYKKEELPFPKGLFGF